jgi:hypothetical protein
MAENNSKEIRVFGISWALSPGLAFLVSRYLSVKNIVLVLRNLEIEEVSLSIQIKSLFA